MAAGPWVFTTSARTAILSGTYNFETDSFKMALFRSTSNLTTASTTFAGVTDECNTGGYVAGGIAVALSLTGTTTVKCDVDTDPVWTVASTDLVAYWAAIYKVAGNIICFCLLDATPASITVTVGNTLTVAAHATNGVFSLA